MAYAQDPDAIALTPTKDGSPAFTIEAMKKYLQRYPGFAGGPTISGEPPTIDTIQFMRSKEASELMHGESTGLSDLEMVCYVVLRGPFLLKNISIPPGMELKEVPIAETLVGVFDAQTRKLLVWGTGP